MKPHLVLFNYERQQPVIEIGCRHSLEHRIFKDREAGVYEEMNPVIDGHMALIQKVLCPALLSTKLTSESRKSLHSALHAHVAKLVVSSQTPMAVSSLQDTTESRLAKLIASMFRVKRR